MSSTNIPLRFYKSLPIDNRYIFNKISLIFIDFLIFLFQNAMYIFRETIIRRIFEASIPDSLMHIYKIKYHFQRYSFHHDRHGPHHIWITLFSSLFINIFFTLLRYVESSPRSSSQAVIKPTSFSSKSIPISVVGNVLANVQNCQSVLLIAIGIVRFRRDTGYNSLRENIPSFSDQVIETPQNTISKPLYA